MANLKAEDTSAVVTVFTFLYNILDAVGNTLIQDVCEITRLKRVEVRWFRNINTTYLLLRMKTHPKLQGSCLHDNFKIFLAFLKNVPP